MTTKVQVLVVIYFYNDKLEITELTWVSSSWWIDEYGGGLELFFSSYTSNKFKIKIVTHAPKSKGKQFNRLFNIHASVCSSSSYRVEMCVQILLLLIEWRIRWNIVIERRRIVATGATTTWCRIVEWSRKRRLRHYRQRRWLWKTDETHWRCLAPTSATQIIPILS